MKVVMLIIICLLGCGCAVVEDKSIGARGDQGYVVTGSRLARAGHSTQAVTVIEVPAGSSGDIIGARPLCAEGCGAMNPSAALRQ